MLVVRLLFNKNATSQDYEYESQDDFNGNVTQTISQVYRFYFYDEFEWIVNSKMSHINLIINYLMVERSHYGMNDTVWKLLVVLQNGSTSLHR